MNRSEKNDLALKSAIEQAGALAHGMPVEVRAVFLKLARAAYEIRRERNWHRSRRRRLQNRLTELRARATFIEEGLSTSRGN